MLFSRIHMSVTSALVANLVLCCLGDVPEGVSMVAEVTCPSTELSAAASGASLLQQSSQKSITSPHDLQESQLPGSPIAFQTPPDQAETAKEKTQLIQQGHELGGHELRLRLEQRERDYERLTAELAKAREDVQNLRAYQAQHPEDTEPRDTENDHEDRNHEKHKSINQDQSYNESVFVPVPFYMHNKSMSAETKMASGHWHFNIFGDALEPTLEADDGTVDMHHASVEMNGGHSKGYLSLLFLFSALVIGSVLQMLLRRFAPAVPYTCGLFLLGVLLSCIHSVNRATNPLHWESWYASVEMWQDLNPHLLFYVFLPALLFGDVMKLKVQLVTACSAQIFLMACPGVLFGAALTALFGRYMLPYQWPWSICCVFGSILSATDPVAVVSLFNSLGVSPKLTMLVSGESLLNDGTAIVLFALALKVALGATLVFWDTVFFFLQMTVVAGCVGVGAGTVAVFLIQFCSSDSEANAMIQVVATICCAYLAFFISESELSSSGVISTVTAGLVLAHSAWPLFISRETVHTVWEAIEFIGNTVIFFLAGLIFAGTMLEAKSELGALDFMWLAILYVSMFLIRGLMMLVLWIPLNKVGSPISGPEGVAIVWSGLRGAVSVAMGMIVDIEPGIHHRIGSQIMFHVGGIAALTLIVNSITTPYVLRALGLAKSDALVNRIGHKLSARIAEHIKHTFEHALSNSQDARFFGANPTMVRAMVPVLLNGELGEASPRQPSDVDADIYLNSQANLEWKLVQVLREVFLRVVQSRYWQGVEDGVHPRELLVSRLLLDSTDQALDNTWECLSDWDIVSKMTSPTMLDKVLGKLAGFWPFSAIPFFSKALPEHQMQLKIYAALSYIEAHTFAQTEIPPNIGTHDSLDMRVQKHVIQESNSQKQKAAEVIDSMPLWLVERCKSEMLARSLLRQHMTEVEHMVEGGFLTKAEAAFISKPCIKALSDISGLPQVVWQGRFGKEAARYDSYLGSTPESESRPESKAREIHLTQHEGHYTPMPVATIPHARPYGSDAYHSDLYPMMGAPRPSFRLANVSVGHRMPLASDHMQYTRGSLRAEPPPPPPPGSVMYPSVLMPLGTAGSLSPSRVVQGTASPEGRLDAALHHGEISGTSD